jgi:GDP-L-fucose synthase
MAEVQARCYHMEYGTKVAIVRPYNVYGPRDDFNLETAPVVPSQIRKILDAKDKVIVWGDGEQTRSFTYVDDEVDGMMLAVEKSPNAEAFNIAAEEEIKIKDLVAMIIRLSGKNLETEYDLSKPTGSPRRCADISKARSMLGYEPKVSLEEGIKRTMDWYRKKMEKES